MTNKNFICISIEHTYYSNSGWVLWCKNKSGYTGDVNMAGIIARSMILCWFTEMNLSILLPTSKTAKSKRALMWSRLVCIALSAYWLLTALSRISGLKMHWLKLER